MAGDFYSIADMAIWPWAKGWEGQQQTLDDKPHFAAWLDRVGARPATAKGFITGAELRTDAPMTAEQQKMFFGIKY